MWRSNAYSSVGSPGSAHGSISISLSLGILKDHSAGTPPMFFNETVTLRGLFPYLIGIFPKSHVKVVKFFYKSWMLMLLFSELLNTISYSFSDLVSSLFMFVNLNRSHKNAVLTCSLRTSVTLKMG
jgi:hypothetical protein